MIAQLLRDIVDDAVIGRGGGRENGYAWVHYESNNIGRRAVW